MANHPYDHADAGLPFIMHLHTMGVVHDPMTDQSEADGVPAVYLGGLEDQPDRAVALIGPWVTDDDSGNPRLRFMVVGRGVPGDQLGVGADMARIYEALWTEGDMRLTADRAVLYCVRVAQDPPMPDENGRYRRVDTYETRMKVPTSFFTST